jgi:hypothetical protein
MSKVRCKSCNTVVESKSVHDWQACKCFTNELDTTGIFVDGGDEYFRCGGNIHSMEILDAVYDGDLTVDRVKFMLSRVSKEFTDVNIRDCVYNYIVNNYANKDDKVELLFINTIDNCYYFRFRLVKETI